MNLDNYYLPNELWLMDDDEFSHLIEKAVNPPAKRQAPTFVPKPEPVPKAEKPKQSLLTQTQGFACYRVFCHATGTEVRGREISARASIDMFGREAMIGILEPQEDYGFLAGDILEICITSYTPWGQRGGVVKATITEISEEGIIAKIGVEEMMRNLR